MSDLALEWASAGVGCALADTIFNPLEVLKVRRQLVTTRTRLGVIGLAKNAVEREGVWRGLWEPGLLATWMRGLSYTGFRIGLYPTVRDRAKELCGGDDGLATRVLAGAVTGCIGSMVFNPVDVIRIRMQGPSPYTSTVGGFAQATREGGGIAALWRGWAPSACRAACLSGAQLATYDTAKRNLKRMEFLLDANGNETTTLHLAASLISGFVAQTVAMPADAARTIVMADTSGVGAGQVLRSTLESHGASAFFRGYWPALARQGPVMLVQMPIVEQLRRFVGLDYF